MKRLLVLLAVSFCLGSRPCAAVPADDGEYVRVTNERADKVVAKLELPDAAVRAATRDTIAQFYRDLNALQKARDARVADIKAGPQEKDAKDAALQAARAEIDAQRDALRRAFVGSLSSQLHPDQVDQVKDALTYGVVPLTFRVYQEMLPNLTDGQKAQIHAWLLEARELAVAGFTSEEKHGFFGKYKGRINNYLSKAGIDMKQAEKEMQARKKKS